MEVWVSISTYVYTNIMEQSFTLINVAVAGKYNTYL